MKKLNSISMQMVLIALFAGVFMPMSAFAFHNDQIPTGIRIQITNVDQNTRQVDFDVLMSSFSSTSSSKVLPSAWIGNRFFYNNYSAYSSNSSEWVLLHPSGIKALDFGDGMVVDATQLAIDTNGPRTYKGSFSHTYAMPGSYTITTKVVGIYLGNTASPNRPVNYGNPIYFTPAAGFSSSSGREAPASAGKKGGTGLNTHSSSHSSTAGFFAYRPNYGTQRFSFNSSSSSNNNMLGISNTAAVTLDAQGPGLGAGIPIPSLAVLSKLLLGLFVALAGGLMLLQRR